MDYLEIEIDSTYATISDSTLSPKDNPVLNVGRTLTNVVGAKIMEVNIPFSYYVISDRASAVNGFPENRLQLFWSVLDQYDIFIPPGNYTGTSLAAVIQTGLQAAIVAFATATFAPPATASCVFSTSTGKFTMTITQTAPTFPANAQNLVFFYAPELGTVLGFPGFTVNWTPAQSAIYTVTSTSIAQVTGPNNLYVNSKILGNICKAYIPESILSVGETNPQMAMVPINVNPGGLIWWQDPSPQEVFDTKNLFSLQKIDFYITAGTDPRPLLFNGLGYQIKLVLFIKYAEQSFSQSGTIGQNRAVLQIRPT